MSLCDRKNLPVAGNFFLQWNIRSYDRKFLLPSILFYMPIIFFLLSFARTQQLFATKVSVILIFFLLYNFSWDLFLIHEFSLWQELSSCDRKFLPVMTSLFLWTQITSCNRNGLFVKGNIFRFQEISSWIQIPSTIFLCLHFAVTWIKI